MACLPKRVALVVGIGKYKTTPLANSVKDARAMSDKLHESGFKTISCFDRVRKDLVERIHEFVRMLDGSTLAVFFYAGHGGVCGTNGQHYMMACDWDGQASEAALDMTGYAVEQVVQLMKDSGSKLNLVMLDACRVHMSTTRAAGLPEATHGWGGSISAPADFLVCYACENLKHAYDGTPEGNGTYTRKLLKHLFDDTPIYEAISRANDAVRKESNEMQIPRMEVCNLEPFKFALGSPATGACVAMSAEQPHGFPDDPVPAPLPMGVPPVASYQHPGNQTNIVHNYIWLGVTCNGCWRMPIEGRRHRCQDCPIPGFELCGSCWDRGVQTRGRHQTHRPAHRMYEVDPTQRAYPVQSVTRPRPYDWCCCRGW